MQWGLTQEQKEVKAAAERTRVLEWHKKFALLPVHTERGWIWLEYYETRFTGKLVGTWENPVELWETK